MKASQKPPVYRPVKGKGKILTGGDLLHLAAFLARHYGFEIDSDEIESVRGTGGNLRLRLSGTGGSGDSSGSVHGIHPFYIRDDGTIHAGTVGTTIPEYDGDPIGEDGNALSLTGDFYVYLEAEFTLSYGASFFLDSATLETVVIISSSTAKVDVQSSTALTAYRLVAQVIDGVVMREQPTHTSMTLTVCDASTGSDGGQACQANWQPS